MAWSGASGELLWQVQPQDSGSSDSYQAQFQSPIIVDADGNGSLEVLLATSRSIGLYAGKTGLPLHCYDSSCDEARVRLRTGSSLKASPAVADVNGDGELDVVIGSGKGGTGTLNAWSFLSEYVGSEPGTHADFASPWAMFRGSGSRSGKFAP
jgi:hypothetical protein